MLFLDIVAEGAIDTPSRSFEGDDQRRQKLDLFRFWISYRREYFLRLDTPDLVSTTSSCYAGPCFDAVYQTAWPRLYDATEKGCWRPFRSPSLTPFLSKHSPGPVTEFAVSLVISRHYCQMCQLFLVRSNVRDIERYRGKSGSTGSGYLLHSIIKLFLFKQSSIKFHRDVVVFFAKKINWEII